MPWGASHLAWWSIEVLVDLLSERTVLQEECDACVILSPTICLEFSKTSPLHRGGNVLLSDGTHSWHGCSGFPNYLGRRTFRMSAATFSRHGFSLLHHEELETFPPTCTLEIATRQCRQVNC